MGRQRVEMGRNGFTLVELVVTVAVMLFLASLATIQFSKMRTKASIEKELKMIYADLMEIRTRALYEKTPLAAKFTRTSFHVYPGVDTSSAPIITRTLPHAVAWSRTGSSFVLKYDTFGITNNPVTLCIEPDDENSSSVDSLVISKTRIRMGKREASACKSESVALK